MKETKKETKKSLCFVLVMVMFCIAVGQNITVTKVSAKSAMTITSQSEFVRCMYKNLLAKEKSFTIKYEGDWKDLKVDDLEKVLNKVWAIDSQNTSDDFDYLRENIKRYSMKISSNGITSQFTFYINYRETKAQTVKVNNQIKKEIKSMKLDEKSDYEKVKAIHNYIVNRVSYDEGYTKYTAYNALFNKSAVCQGYALLFYKMTTEAGIPCRIVASQDHEWNIVKLGDKWYHVDVTWDDPISDKPVLRYDYFLKGSRAVSKTHKLLSTYRTKTFTKSYPISTTNYKK